MTLVFLYNKEMYVSLQKHILIFINLMPWLREVGTNVLLDSMKRQVTPVV